MAFIIVHQLGGIKSKVRAYKNGATMSYQRIGRAAELQFDKTI